MMNKMHIAIREAFNRGYVVNEDGVIYGLKGKPLKVKNNKSGYPAFTLNGFHLSKSKTYKIPIHRMAAYCFYGEESLKDDIVVRHLNSNVMDFSKNNIAIGTQSENLFDIPLEKRILKTAKLTFEQVKEIRKRRSEGEKVSDISKDYPVNLKSLYNVINKECYKNVV